MLESRGGESIKGSAIADPELIDLGRAVAEALPLRGPATVQMFRDTELGLRVTDINARFGGAFACPMYAALPGRTYPELIVKLAVGERVEPHVGEFLRRADVHALLLADRARRGAAADRPGHRPGRSAPPALMRSLLITIVGLIAVLALLDVVVTGPEEQAPAAAVRDPDRHFASRPTSRRRRSRSRGARATWSSSRRSARTASPGPRSSTRAASTCGSSRCRRASSRTTCASRTTAGSRC